VFVTVVVAADGESGCENEGRMTRSIVTRSIDELKEGKKLGMRETLKVVAVP